VSPTPFPAPSKTHTTTIAGLPTTATTLYFADKILITITQNGRLAHWVRHTGSLCPFSTSRSVSRRAHAPQLPD
jgi:hypothetical protein